MGACTELGNHVFDCSDRKQAEKCNKALKAIATHVGKSEHRQADMLKYMVLKGKEPMDELKEPEDITDEDANNRIKFEKWKEKLKRHLDKIDSYEREKKKLHTLTWGQCTQMVQHELEALADFEAMDDKQDPVKLIKNIKQVIHEFRDQKHVFGSMWTPKQDLCGCVQREHETTKQFYDRFCSLVEVIEQNG